MPDWVAPVVTCVLVVVLLVIAERAAIPAKSAPDEEPAPEPSPPSKSAAASKTSKTSKTSKASKANAASQPPDSIESLTVQAPAAAAKTSDRYASSPALPKLDTEEEEEDVDPTKIGPSVAGTKRPVSPPTKKIVYDEDAANDEPTKPGALILVTATAQTDKGVRRKRNEDSLLVMPDDAVYVVADGMGGYNGGEIASELAVRKIEHAFKEHSFPGEPHDSIPSRASELARAIQIANEAILERAGQDKKLEGMGTTICAARFSPNKQRLYVAHVGDSRMYRVRGGKIRQMTSDHTMRDFGMTGPGSDHLSRAVGVWPTVPIDILLAKPMPGDVYLICSDGLTKMVDDEAVAEILSRDAPPDTVVEDLIKAANERGGKDNITAILIRVYEPGARAKA